MDTAAKFAEFVPVCPEVEVGLGVPRPTIRLQRDGDLIKLVRPSDGHDLTARMRVWAEERVAQIAEMNLSGFVLKKDSPSCGMERVRVYDQNGSPTRDGRGIFAEVLTERLPLLPVEEDGRLRDAKLRENFFERAFAYDRLRKFFADGWTPGDVVRFHSCEKLLLLSHDPKSYAELGRLVANVKGQDRNEFAERYQRTFMGALAKQASPGRQVNVLEHIAGYFSEKVGAAERAEIVALLEDYRQGFVPLAVPLALIRHHVTRFPLGYIQAQSYLSPHPKQLSLRSHV
jgi:uncharacterized protein YbgA (DUF1722 family)/uncharacterized protein YbbK (DUF523 family)